ncbi:MAG: hypothetical protein DRI57_30265 [Deltaproteobacteria bacterium]|nr:MAG: hypothetical protein DRI57_30265 [Deltaproteobacteria bacterium]
MKKIVTALIIGFVLLGTTTQANAAPELSLSSATMEPGGTASLNLTLAGGTEAYAGVNAKILLPQGVSLTGISRGELLSSGSFTIDYQTSPDGMNNGATIIAYSGTDTFSASDGVLLILNLQAADDTAPGDHQIDFATTDTGLVNSKYALSNADGSVSVSPAPRAGSIIIESESKDIDSDGLPDSWEQQIIDAQTNDAIMTVEDVNPEDDFDGDGDSNLTEYTNNTGPTDPTDFNINPDDTDRDGLPDTWEQQIVDEYIRDDITAIGDVNPEDDFDGDRDTNLTEHENGTDPTDPTDFTVTPDDSDRDAMPDTWEQQIIDADPDDNIITIEDVNPHDDFDGDEKSNLMEYDNGTDPIIPAPIQPGDLDGDEHLTLADAVIALKIACGLDSGVLIGADADGDGKIGVAEVVFILQKVAGFEANPEF